MLMLSLMSSFTYLLVGASVASLLAMGGRALIPRELYDPACNIKGNVSYNGGQQIYHVPGQHYYTETAISYAKGARWFCSEDDARAAGWRRAGY
ncbi:sunset domain-containing protein [Shinella sp.]|uniref:sunset domain-containing protein n=1 Tax=Shinella sp. TaxID=1870904 RepID=UPI003F726FB8